MDKKIILWLAKGILIIVAASWLFYGNIYFSILMSPWLYLYIRENSKNNKRKERQQLALQFKDAMTAVSFALNAGYSVENSFKEALEELKMLYGKEQLEINIIFKDGSPSIVLTTSVLSDPSAFQEAYQNARDKIVPDDIYTASIIRNSNKIISKIEFSQQ